jgi:hypothetical protein
MGAWIRTLWDAVLFKTEAYERVRDRRDAVMQGFFVIVIVALLVALPSFVTQIAQGLRPAEAEIADARAGFRTVMDNIAPYLSQMGLPSAAGELIMQQAEANFDSVAQMIAEIEALPTALPRPIGKTLTAFGAWVSHPFGSASFPLSAAVLATWLGYGVWVMLAAKLMGGRGTLTGFFGTTALFAVPHLLDFFRWVPYVGSLLGFVAFIWGLAIYVKATAVSHKFRTALGFLALVLPVIAVGFLSILLIFGAGAVALVAGLAGQGR